MITIRPTSSEWLPVTVCDVCASLISDGTGVVRWAAADAAGKVKLLYLHSTCSDGVDHHSEDFDHAMRLSEFIFLLSLNANLPEGDPGD